MFNHAQTLHIHFAIEHQYIIVYIIVSSHITVHAKLNIKHENNSTNQKKTLEHKFQNHERFKFSIFKQKFYFRKSAYLQKKFYL